MALVEEYARHAGIVPTTMEEASRRKYDSAIAHSYAHWGHLSDILAAIDVSFVDYYADGLRNELRFRPSHPGIVRTRSLVYFGYALHNDLVESQLGPLEQRVVALDDYASFWRWLALAHPSPGASAGDSLLRDDVLVAMRYWGRSQMYPTLSPLTAADVVGRLELPESTKRIVLRNDPRSLVSFPRMVERVRQVVPEEIAVTTWDEVVGHDPSLGSLDVLDRSVCSESWNLGGFFGYDGTPNLLVGAFQPSTRIVWASEDDLHSAIIEPIAATAASETIRIQQDVLAQLGRGVSVPTVRTSGVEEASVLDRIAPESNLGLDNWTRSESAAVLLAALDVVGLDESADAGEVIARLHGLLADRLRFEKLATESGRIPDPTVGTRAGGVAQ